MFSSIKNLLGGKGTLSENPFKVDLHSHLIPGIDDGVVDLQEALTIVRRFSEMGYQKLITTPHSMSHRFPNDSKTILEGCKALQRAVVAEGLPVEIEAASEYYLDETVMDAISKRDVLTFGNNYFLFELSHHAPMPHLHEWLHEIKLAGYKLLLAHPERYPYFFNDFSKIEALKERGVFFQLNLISLSEFYSPVVKKNALKLIDAGMIDFVGSDAHSMHYLDALEMVLKDKRLLKRLEANPLRNLELLS
ncbi:tyrosine-protein phosphatase [Thiomicrorhabdus sp.]|uniref:tyrosine-protein phosphatase n=1 Tax=Thiomicrorhabdus sp. TaxID=2039724 RepID=UPI0029C65E4D|nr:CpsB/CapC family capsule biosynthesis tyrosine phosphatase [Thiomicrorhabdus sp.]